MIRHLPFLAAALLLADAGRAQRARAVVVPIGGPGAIDAPRGDPEDDEGVNVELFENPNLDRYLRKAQNFLTAENYLGAIKVLQDVIEGRTVESSSVEPESTAPEAGAAKPPEEKPGSKPGPKPGDAAPRRGTKKVAGQEAEPAPKTPVRPLDPSQTVFSQNGRLYRPVRRLCHELLATMPTQGIELYRTNYEVAAEELLQAAVRSGQTSQLELVGNRYFVTLAAGRAMVLLADQLMHLGRYRAAVQVLRDLVEVYPTENRKKLGVSEVWCQFKIALCIRLAGEVAVARERAAAMAQKWSDESLRIMGELQAVKELPDSALFRDEGRLIETVAGQPVDSQMRWFGGTDEPLVPLWQFRYQTPVVYGTLKNRAQNERFGGEGIAVTAQPPATKYGTHTMMAFFGSGVPDRLVFYDHFRLRVADAFTGVQLQENAGPVDMPKPQEGRPRLRVPAYDFGLLRPAADGDRWFAIEGANKSVSTVEAARNNKLLAHDRASMNRVWSSEDWSEGEDGLRDVSFLAAPTVFGARILLPVLRHNAYALQCLDAATGRPLWCTPIHAGGSQFHRAPGTPVAVVGGIAYVLTNAGALAAVDAFAGDLRWIRRYERRDPKLRPKKAGSRGRTEPFTGNQFVERDLAHHLPSDLVTAEGLVIFAPCDGDVVLCLDGASGEPVWMIEGDSSYAAYGRLQCLVGANSKFLFAASETDLVCIGLRSGVRRWSQPLSTADQDLTHWRGRGTVLEDVVLMPGAREVLIYDAAGKLPPRRAALPQFAIGPEPLRGPNAVFSAGPWLGVAYQGGIEVYSTAAALRQLAAANSDPLARAGYLVMAGEPEVAIDALIAHLGSALPQDQQKTTATRLLGLCRERALELAKAGKPQDGIALLDRVLPHMVDRGVRMNWHLARLDLWQQANDIRGHEEEQQRLYRYIEGRQ